MLILTRRTGESIVISDEIEIRVLDIGDGRVKIGIEAPRNVKVLRKEVQSTIEANIEATKQRLSADEIKNILK